MIGRGGGTASLIVVVLAGSRSFAGIRIGKTELRQDLPFARFHRLRLVFAQFVIVTQQMQQAMHDQMCVVRPARLALCTRFSGDDPRTEHQIAAEQWSAARIRERQHVGGMRRATIATVQAKSLALLDETEGDFAG